MPPPNVCVKALLESPIGAIQDLEGILYMMTFSRRRPEPIERAMVCAMIRAEPVWKFASELRMKAVPEVCAISIRVKEILNMHKQQCHWSGSPTKW